MTTIAGGYTYSLASRLDGSVVPWGTGTYTNFGVALTNVVAVSAGVNGALALRSDGIVVGSGQLNPLSYKVFPSNVVAIAAGYQHGLALRAEGTVVGWGSLQTVGGSPSAAIAPAGLTKVVAIAAGYQHSLALRNDGTVVAWGAGPTNVPSGLSNVVAIAAGPTHSLALKSDGTLVTWGTGPATNIPAGLTNIMAIAAGGYPDQRSGISLAVQSNGTVVAWGYSPYNQTNVPAGLSNVVAVADGAYHSLALVNNGSPFIIRPPAGGTAFSGRDFALQAVAVGASPLNYQWLLNGTNLPGATNTSLLLPAIQSSNAGIYQIVVSNSFGVATSVPAPVTVMNSAPFLLTQPPTNLSVFLGSKVSLSVALGGSGPLQYQWLFNGTNIPAATGDTLTFDRVRITNAGAYSVIVTNGFGAITSAVINLTVRQVVAWGDNSYGQTNLPPSLTNVAAVAAGFYGSMALCMDGTISIWGNSGYVPTNIPPGVSNVVEIATGYFYDMALMANGKAVAWGSGVGSVFTNAVVSQSNVVAMEASSSSCALLHADGTVVRITSAGASPVTGLTNIVALAPFDDGFMALRADGSVCSLAGGYLPPPTSNVLAIATGRYAGVFLKRDGTFLDVGTPAAPSGVSNIIGAAVADSSGAKLLVSSNGTIVTSGLSPATNAPSGLASVWTLDAGYNHGLALLSAQNFPPVFLPDALNTTALVVSSKNSPQWFGQTNTTHDGVAAAQSAAMSDNGVSSMRLWVAGPITVSFWWKVSSETNHDFLSFSAGGVLLTNISGEVDWKQCTVSVPTGNQILAWTYAKDGSGSAGQDAGWVDQLQFIPQPPSILVQPASQTVLGPTNVTLAVSATGTPPLVYRWWKNGALWPVPTGDNPTVIITNAVRADSGTYSVVVTNTGGKITSSNAVLIVHVPQWLGTPALQPDGSILLFSTDVGGGQLSSADLANLQAQASTNLVDWVTLPGALTLSNGVVELQDPGSTNSPDRYYRMIENW